MAARWRLRQTDPIASHAWMRPVAVPPVQGDPGPTHFEPSQPPASPLLTSAACAAGLPAALGSKACAWLQRRVVPERVVEIWVSIEGFEWPSDTPVDQCGSSTAKTQGCRAAWPTGCSRAACMEPRVEGVLQRQAGRRPHSGGHWTTRSPLQLLFTRPSHACLCPPSFQCHA